MFAESNLAAARTVLEGLSVDGLSAQRDIAPAALARVQLAVLKLAGGSLESLQREVQAAVRDPRDVIAYAENPGYMRQTIPGRLQDAEREAILVADWAQYQSWLSAP